MDECVRDLSFIFLVFYTTLLKVHSADSQNCQAQLNPSDTGCCGHDFYSYQKVENYPNVRAMDKTQIDEWLISHNASLEGVGRRISEGTEAEPGRFPWMVYIESSINNKVITCAGSLITAAHILTAAHCVHIEGERFFYAKIFIGEHNLNSFPMDCKSIMGIEHCIHNVLVYAKDVVYHAQYNRQYLYNDIALIKLPNTVQFSKYIQPICVPSFDLNKLEYANTPLIIAGWGSISQYGPSYGIKLKADVHLVGKDTCKLYIPYIINSQICTAGNIGEDFCKGDSGGPLMLLYNGTYYLIGIISGKNSLAHCGSLEPSFTTNVFQFLPWIYRQIGVH